MIKLEDRRKCEARLPATNASALKAGIGKLATGFLYLVDSGIPFEMRQGDPDIARRARIILSFTLALIVLGLETGVFFSRFLEPVATLRVELALVVGLSLTALIPLVFRRLRSLAIATNLIISAAYIVTIAVFTVIGGINSPLIHWCALLPLLAVLMGARSSAWIWTIISICTVVFFILADAVNWEFKDMFGFSALQGPALWFQQFVNVGSWLGILLAVALLFEAHKNEQTSLLATKNAELESQVQQRNLAEQRSQYLAFYDELTGLPNRRLFLEQLSAAIGQTSRLNRMVGLLFLDLDHFKEVNDMHGHALGDQLLQQVAERLRGCLRQSDRISRPAAEEPGHVARLGGDEFTVLLHGIHGPQDAAIVAERIIESMRLPFVLGDLELFIGTSIGIAFHAAGDANAGDLLRNADLAMYKAKSTGKGNFKFHQESMNSDIVFRTTMTDALRKALEKEELELYFQPIVEAETRSVVGVEGLLRWHPNGDGPVSTEMVIDIAEKSGLIIPLGSWVISEACRRFQEWREAGIDLRRMAINLSGEQFRRGNVVEVVQQALLEFNMEPGHLEIEITESAMMLDETKTLRALEQLRHLGVKISLDDFGTGYSSLSYVHRFPVDVLKIDRSFVVNIENDQGSRAIAMAVIALAHQMGLKVVGEGVENAQQEHFLLENGCDELQGYLYSKPRPAGEILTLLFERTAG
ncbi:MAG TPA: EAL domain-containing protein [Halioglobus sp.]